MNQEQNEKSAAVRGFALETSPENFPDLFTALDMVVEAAMSGATKFCEEKNLPPSMRVVAVYALLQQSVMHLEPRAAAAGAIVKSMSNLDINEAGVDCPCPKCVATRAAAGSSEIPNFFHAKGGHA